jgi:hypothetical protein
MAWVRFPERTWIAPHEANARLYGEAASLEGKTARPLWHHLRYLPNLTHLEIDALYLTRFDTVKRLLRLGARSLRCVKFVERSDMDERYCERPTVFPVFAEREILSNEFTEGVARVMKGKRGRQDVKGARYIQLHTMAMRARLRLVNDEG